MKRVFGAFVVLLVFNQSCGSKNTGVHFIHPKSKIYEIFSPIGVNAKDYDFTTVTFNTQNFIYQDSSKNTILDTLHLGHEIHLQTTFGIAAYGTTLPFYNLIYIDEGNIKKGVIFDEDIAYSTAPSVMDSTMLYIAKYEKEKHDAKLVIKAIGSNKVIDVVEVDKGLSPYYDIILGVVSSAKITNDGEMLFCEHSYPACGNDSKWYYLNFKNNRFYFVCEGGSWLNEKKYTTIYFPNIKKNKYVLSEMYGDHYWPDKLPVSLPIEFQDNADKIILIETHSYEGDQLEMKNDRVVEKKWFKWDTEQMVELKVERF